MGAIAAAGLQPDYLGALRALVAAWVAGALAIFKSEGEGEGEGAGGGEGGGTGAGAAGGGDAGKGDDGSDDDEMAELIAKYGEAGAREVKRLRNENAGHRVRRTEAERRLAEREQAEMTEAQRNAKRAEDAEKERDTIRDTAKTRAVTSEVKSVAATLGAVDPDAVAALVARDEIKIDDEFNVTGVKKAVEALLKEKPYLKGAGGGEQRSGGDMAGGGGEGGKVSMNDALRRSAGYKV